MTDKGIGISQQTLVSNTGHQNVRAKKMPQYIASLSSTLGALAAGMTLGWTSSAGSDGIDFHKDPYMLPITPDEFSWIGSLTTLGSAVVCIPIGVLADLVGRKYAMLMMVVPFTLGWLLIICANSVLLLYIGRFITGISGGGFCIAAPMYTAEIAESDIRGSLGNYFQLLLCVGILLSYVLGSAMNMRILSIISAIVPLIFFAIFVFMPESPIYYLKKGNEEAARQSLIKLRGAHYNVDDELQSHKEALDKTGAQKVSFLTMFKSRAVVRGFIIAYGLMIFQQLSGVNTVIFYSSDIFTKAGKSLNPKYASIIVGVMQIVGVFLSTLIVDRLGRRILLLASIILLFLTSFILGVYFYLSENKPDISEEISWLPLVVVCVFIIMFNLGFGPIPWMMLGEIFAPEVKGMAASSAGVLNWILAFVVTKFYTDLKGAMDASGTFWLYAGFSAIGIFFVYFLIPETKGKSLDEIQRELNR
ncbi:facilitated trehalose transporter Tret1-2 homolog [Andrena cerasifolii]|uniref:facilitated trehalose transporter Tret1-2 homolog n=1 Tax=Andrena cerasifolii TaxID=2819439 RepID=UPI004037645E